MCSWFYLILVYIAFPTYECCPTGYIQCAGKDNECTLSGDNIIAFGDNGFRWGYQKVNGNFVCNHDLLCDPAASTCDPVENTLLITECCYQNPKMTEILWTNSISSNDWLAGNIECNERIHSYFGYNTQQHIWEFTTSSTWTVTFSSCESSADDTQLHLYATDGSLLMESAETYLEIGCGYHEEFVFNSLPVGTYYIWISPPSSIWDNSGSYQLSVGCDGAPNFEYNYHVLTCEDNMITGTTISNDRTQYFEISTQSKHDIIFDTCDSTLHGELLIYSDSLYQHQIGGGNDNNCGVNYGEQYTLTLDAGNYYAKMDPQCGLFSDSDCYGDYVFGITCSGTYPTAEPTTTPTAQPIGVGEEYEEEEACKIHDWSTNYINTAFQFTGECINNDRDTNSGKFTGMILTLVSVTDGSIGLVDLEKIGNRNWLYENKNGLTDTEYGVSANRNTLSCLESDGVNSVQIDWKLVVFKEDGIASIDGKDISVEVNSIKFAIVISNWIPDLDSSKLNVCMEADTYFCTERDDPLKCNTNLFKIDGEKIIIGEYAFKNEPTAICGEDRIDVSVEAMFESSDVNRDKFKICYAFSACNAEKIVYDPFVYYEGEEEETDSVRAPSLNHVVCMLVIGFMINVF